MWAIFVLPNLRNVWNIRGCRSRKKAAVDVGSWFVYLLGECGSDDIEPLAVAQSM